MLLLEGYISNFTCVRYYFLYVEFSNFYVNQSLAGQTIHRSEMFNCKIKNTFGRKMTYTEKLKVPMSTER
jgi:hypothetical protein